MREGRQRNEEGGHVDEDEQEGRHEKGDEGDRPFRKFFPFARRAAAEQGVHDGEDGGAQEKSADRGQEIDLYEGEPLFLLRRGEQVVDEV